MKTCALCGVIAALALYPLSAAAEEVTMQDVPPAARAAAQAAGNGAKFEKVGLDLDGGTATYEFAGKNSDGKAIEIDVTADGSVEEVEKEVSMEDVPEAVKSLLSKHMPKFKPELVEKSVRGNFEVYYEFEGKGEDGKELDVEVRSDGKQIIVQDDLAG